MAQAVVKGRPPTLEVERAEENLRRGVKTLPPRGVRLGAGTPLDLYNATRVFKRVLKAAELPNFRLYDLRHTFASLLLAQNAPITYVAAQLGHAKPTKTLQWYAHWLPTNRGTTSTRPMRGRRRQRLSRRSSRRRRGGLCQHDVAPIGRHFHKCRRIPSWKCGRRLAPFINTYRTLCLAPSEEIVSLFTHVRGLALAG